MKNIIIFLYFIFLILFTFFSYIFIDSNIFDFKYFYFGIAFSNRLLTTAFYITSVVIFFIFYGIFIYQGIKRQINLKKILTLLCATAVILLFSYPAMLSYDIFNYLATAKVLFSYQENPYLVMPIEFTGDPLLVFMHAANKIALYGPFWIALTGIPYLLGMGNFIFTLFTFKLFVAIFYLATVFLIWKISKSIIPVLLFAFNPLVIIETLISGHNDIVMMFFVLFSFFLLMRKRIFLAILFCILSILIKYATILLLPIFLYALCRIVQNKEINWKNIFYFSAIFMLIGFLFSPLREEIYPWYAIWFMLFSFLVPAKKVLLYISIAFSFSLLLRYIPFIFLGTYAGLTPMIKLIVTFMPPFLALLYFVYKKIWGKISFQ